MQDLLYLMNNYVNGAVGRRSGRRYRRSIRKRRKRKKGDTYSSCFALVFQSFLRVLRCRLDVVDSVLDIVFDSVDHFTLFVTKNRLFPIDHRLTLIASPNTSILNLISSHRLQVNRHKRTDFNSYYFSQEYFFFQFFFFFFEFSIR